MITALFLTPERRLRLGFRLLLGVMAFLLAVILREAAKYGLHALGVPRPLYMLLGAPIEIGAFLGMTIALRRRVDRKSWAGMALPPPSKGKSFFLVGFVLSTVLLLLAVGIQLGAQWIEVTPGDVWTTAVYLIPGLAISLCVGFNEELLFRGYVLQNLGEEMPLWPATLVSGVVFAMLHGLNGGFGLGFVVSVATLTVFFVVMRLSTGSLWFAIGFHAAWDWAQTFLVGLSTVNSTQDHSLFHVHQHGPKWMVGEAPSIEGGALYTLLFLAVLAGAYAYASSTGKRIQWRLP